MKKIMLFSPSISSMNVGDEIITTSAKKELRYVIDENFIVEVSTQMPVSLMYSRHLKDMDYTFVLGSNLLKSTFFGLKRQWDITLHSCLFVRPVILVGVGWWQYGNKPNLYTKLLLKSILSKKHIHSVRDEYTLNVLKDMGFSNVINTACPTMWSLNKDFCRQIPTHKSKNVIFTLTDYNKDFILDKKFVEILLDSYEDVYFWPQGIGDLDYFNELCNEFLDDIIIIPPTLAQYENILNLGNIDYVGTRLHGGIKSLQYKIRTIIIAIDNRAIEKSKNFNLPILKRENILQLKDQIFSNFITDISIPEENISKWKEQFK